MAKTVSHPAAHASEQDRVAYVGVVASIAWADRELHDAESSRLRELCVTLELPTEVADRFTKDASAPSPEEVQEILSHLRQQGLNVALLGDVVMMMFADGRIASGEAEEVARFAETLGLQTGQAILISRYVEGVMSGQSEEALTRELAGKLAALPGPVPPHSVLAGLMARLRGRRS